MRSLYEQVFPLPEEREVFLRLAGYALWGRRPHKLFAVLTDQRKGNNGKSTVLRLLEKTLGGLALANQSKFLYVGANEGANSHSSGDLSFKGKRLGVFDETNRKRQLDVEKIKRCTGGGLTLSVRAANAAEVVEFEWTALLVIGCNQGNLPRFPADDALASRMVVIPARAKFVDDPAPLRAAGEEHVFRKDTGLADRLADLRCANLHALLDALARFRADDGLGRLPE